MNEFQQNFFNACAKMLTMINEVEDPKDILDNIGLDGNFLLTEINEAMDMIPPDERLAFGILLGILYEQQRINVGS